MSQTDEKNYQPRRFKAEVKRAKVVRKRDKAPDAPKPEEWEDSVLTPQEQKQPEEPSRILSQAEETVQVQPDPIEAPVDEPELAMEAGTDEEYVDKTRIMPEEEFEYVVPHESFKQHNSRKHVSSHSGNTKTASVEEQEAADAGYIFTRHRKHKRKHRHRHHKFRHLPLWKRIVIIAVIIILSLTIALGGTFLILNEIGRRSMHDYENVDISTPSKDETGDDIIKVDKSGRVITYDGVTYELNENLISVAFIGADEGTGDNENLQMADAIYIMTVDTETGAMKILGVSRDTMADVDLYSEEGRFIDTEREQIAFSYAYGNDEVTGGRNTTVSLSRLFYNLPFENFFAINMKALVTLNDTIGGVTLTSSMTFTSPIDGRTISEGETVTLHGKEADYYVRYRDTEILDSNVSRMQRQQEYIRAFMSSMIPAAKKDLSIVSKLYDEIQVNSETSLNLPKLTYIASTAVTKVRSASDIEYISLKGNYTEGEYAQLNVSNKDTMRTMLDVFYTPLAQVPDGITE